MDVSVWLPGVLRQYAGGQTTVRVDAGDAPTVGTVFDRLAESHPALDRRIRDEQGRVRQHVNVFVGRSNIRDAQGLDTPAESEISVVPAVSGG